MATSNPTNETTLVIKAAEHVNKCASTVAAVNCLLATQDPVNGNHVANAMLALMKAKQALVDGQPTVVTNMVLAVNIHAKSALIRCIAPLTAYIERMRYKALTLSVDKLRSTVTKIEEYVAKM